MDLTSSNAIILDLLLFAYVALGVGIGFFVVLRRTNPLARWGSRGNVYTGSYELGDLPLVAIILVLYYWFISTATSAAEGGTPVGDGPTTAADIVSFSMIQIVITGSFLLYLAFGRGISLSEAFGLRHPRASKVILWAIGGIIVAYALVFLANHVTHAYILPQFEGAEERQGIVQDYMENDDFLFRVALVFSAVVIAPLTEEFLFRGVLYGIVKAFSERYFAAIVTSLIFAIVHAHVPTIIPLWVLALCLCAAYELSGSLWVPVLVHSLFNLINVIAMTEESAAASLSALLP